MTTPNPITLYTNPQSRGRIARWMLEEVGADYQIRVLPYGGAMQQADFRAINPMGKVPTLVYGEQIISEAAAICAFLADVFPEVELAPPPAERGVYYYSGGQIPLPQPQWALLWRGVPAPA